MKYKNTLVRLLSLGISSLALASPVTFLSPSQISNGITLSDAGAYILTDNANTTNSISLVGPSITFDLNGKTISCSADDAISIESSNVVVRNGTIQNSTMGTGISIDSNGQYAVVTDITFEGCMFGLFANDVTNVQVQNCYAYGTTMTAFVFQESDGLISNCGACFGVNGFWIENGSSVTVKNCIAFLNTSTGFYSGSEYSDSLFLGNIAFQNGLNYGGGATAAPNYPITNSAATQTTSNIPPIDHTLVNYNITG